MTHKNSFAGLLIVMLLLQTFPVRASSWNPTLLVNTETFQIIDDSDGDSDLYVRFGDSLDKRLTFERTLDRFNFNDDVYISGELTIKGTASGKILRAQDLLTSSGKLIVKDTARFQSGALIRSSAPILTFRNSVTAQQWEMKGDSAFSIYDATAQKTRFMIGSLDGNTTIGTGTTVTNSRLYVWGGPSGANIDVRGDSSFAGGDQATIELEGRNYDTDPNSVRLQYYGAGHGLNTTMGFTNSKLGVLAWQGVDTALIDVQDYKPLIIGTNNKERMRLTETGSLALGTATPGLSKLSVSGAVIIGNNIGSGAAKAGISLEVIGTASGRILHGTNKIQGSGSLITDGSISTKTNLTMNSDNGAADAVLTFGSDGTAETLTFANAGDRFEFTDDVYVGSTLEVGGNALFNGETEFDGANLTIGDASGDAVIANSATWTFANDTTFALTGGVNGLNIDSNTLSVDATNNRIGIGTATPAYELDVTGTIHASSTIASSGSLIWEGAASGASLWVSKFKGAGLVSACDPTTGKLTWNSTLEQFACGTDQTGGSAGQGLTLSSGVFSLTPTFSGTSLEIIGTASGRVIHAQDSLRSSGTLIVQSTGLVKGNLSTRGTLSGAALTAMNGTSYMMGDVGIGIASPTSAFHVVDSIGSLSAQGDATYFNIATTAQADTNTRTGMRVDLTDGYVAAGSTIALSFLNSVAGTATNMIDITGNAGVRGNVNPTTTGYNYGTVGIARGGNLNVGMYGRSFVAKNSASNVGAFGIARNTGTTPVEIGGFFGLYGTAATAPTLVSAGLAASNGVSTSPIFLARDNDTTVFSIIDGGNVGIGTSSADSTLEVIGTASGRILRAQDTLASSGTLVLKKHAGTSTGNILIVDTTGLVYDATNKRVGIGTTSPGAKLEISREVANETDGLRISNKWVGGYGNLISFYSRQNFGSNLDKEAARIQVQGESSWNADATTDSHMHFDLMKDGTLTEAMRIKANGNVGIGTTSPAAKLSVSGSLIVQSLAKQGSGAVAVVPAEYQTGAYLFGSGASIMALESYTQHKDGSQPLAPSILFGYKGVFDTNLYRASGSTLRSDGQFLLTSTDAFNRPVFKIDTTETTGTQNIVEMYSSVTESHDLIFRFRADGQAYADGSWNSGGADLAEWFATADTGMRPGDLACLDPKRPLHVKRCNSVKQRIVGIISTKPGFVGGQEEKFLLAGKIPVLVGLLGQIPVKVVGPVEIGDIIGLSGTVDGVGAALHEARQSACMALEPFNGEGIGVVICLAPSPQVWSATLDSR